MCALCSAPTPSAPSRRKTLPGLKTGYHCSIIGTCFSIAELHKLIRKIGLELPPNASAHDIHAAFVAMAEEPAAGRILSKTLDGKFRQAIHRFRLAASDEDLRRLWQEENENGRPLGAFWAVMTHPHASEKLRHDVHGEVHMFSHEAFRERKREGGQIGRLRQENTELRQELARFREKRREAVREHREETAVLADRLRQVENKARQYRQTARELEELKSGAGLRRLQERLAALEGELACRTAESEDRQRQLTRLGRELDRLRPPLLIAEPPRPPAAGDVRPDLQGPLNCLACQDHQTAACPGLDLCGRKILYVGGVNRLIPHYRELIEKHGGSFFHHDGGKEESRKRLPQLLCQVDAVFCPINCVSHDACLCVKKICKRQAKPFVLMRSSSLSALSEGLRQLT
jgi:hypothetical protein